MSRVLSKDPRNILRSRRFKHMRDAGVDYKEARKAATSPQRYADLVTAVGGEPDPELAHAKIGGHPRIDTPESRRFREFYHDLKRRGADSLFASEYGRSENLYSMGVRILNGEEIE